MNRAASNLIERAALLRVAAADPLLSPKPPDDTEWNERARLIKVGICVGALTTLEEFFEARVREVISQLHGFSPNSQALPAALRSALIEGALESLIVRVKDPKRFSISDPRDFALKQIKKIASMLGPGMDPSDLVLARNGSNLSWTIVENALTAFGVESASSVVNGVARRLEGGIFVAKDHFESVLAWRHKVAHSTDANVPLGDIDIFVTKLVLLAASLDIVLSTALKRIQLSPNSLSSITTKNSDIRIRFVEKRKDGSWRHLLEGKARGRSFDVNLDQCVHAAKLVATPQVECVAVRTDISNSPIASWVIPFL